MSYENKCEINRSHRSRVNTPDEALDGTRSSCKDSCISNTEVDTCGTGNSDEQDIDVLWLRGSMGGTEMEHRDGIDTSDMIEGHRMELLYNLRVEINGPNVGSREWWGSTLTKGDVAAG